MSVINDETMYPLPHPDAPVLMLRCLSPRDSRTAGFLARRGQNIAAQAAKTHAPVIETCDAGMMKLVVPIFVNGDFLGVAGGCGCLEKTEKIDTFMITKTTGIDEEKLIKLSEDIPFMSRDEASTHAGFIENEIDRILKAHEKKQ